MSQQNVLSHTYQPALDGLRAIAILWVLFHNGRYLFAGLLEADIPAIKVISLFLNVGWLGVQLFFVLSGFLITGILIDAKAQAAQSSRNISIQLILKRFYMRRVLRIFPAYYVFLLVMFGLVALLPQVFSWMQEAYDTKAWFLLYVSNWIQPFESVGLGHIWSLAVEEQFYMVWPLIVLCLSQRKLVWACVLGVFVAIFFRFGVVWSGVEFETSPAYIMTPARLDALLLGALLAIVVRHSEWHQVFKTYIKAVVGLSLFYILATLVITNDFSSIHNNWPMLNQTFAALLFVGVIYYALVGSSASRSGILYHRVLSLPWLRVIGKYSYAMYIIHWPLSRALKAPLAQPLMDRLEPDSVAEMLLVMVINETVLFGLTFALAWLSWRLLEQPFLRLKKRWPM